ncbi:MAG: Sir2 family NAD-dependent protein deacetylase [Planctomycetota bacterium]
MSITPDPRFVEWIREAQQILVFTGAGISTGSGIPDYRGPSGIWHTKQPVYYQDFMSKESSRVEYWQYKTDSWKTFRNAEPNPTHEAIVRLEEAGKLLMLVTQNVDGLHSKAGTADERLIELHGSNSKIECQSCNELSNPDPFYEQFAKDSVPPICGCGGYLKPATISFGQSLRDRDLSGSMDAAQKADMVIALGSSLSVSPAADIPILAAERGVPYVIVNRGFTEHDSYGGVSLRIDADVAAVFPSAVDLACFPREGS